MKKLIQLFTGIAIILIAWQYDTTISYLFLLSGSIITGYSIGKFFKLIPFKKTLTITDIEILIIVIAVIVAFIYPLFQVYEIMKPFYSNTQITIGIMVVYTCYLLWYFLFKSIYNHFSKNQ
jgi:undecaprenyl pyrophosphate phosphatase UppP